MVEYPDVQKKAQAEIDRVIGHGRLPTFPDREDMPYMDCILKEIMRWKKFLPFGIILSFLIWQGLFTDLNCHYVDVAHRLIEDDDYNGLLFRAVF